MMIYMMFRDWSICADEQVNAYTDETVWRMDESINDRQFEIIDEILKGEKN